MRTRLFLSICAIACSLFGSAGTAGDMTAQDALSRYLIGYREYRTNVPGGRAANWATMRAYVIRADGSGRRELAHELVRDENTWTAVGGWSPDGRTAIIENGHNPAENGAWEEANKTFRMTAWLYDCYLLDMATGRMTNVSAPERMSNYNGSVAYWPGNPRKLLGNALINGINHPVSMDLDGRNKRDLTGSSVGFTYGAQVSPDGKQIAYHNNYQAYIANADGSNPRHIVTGNDFNFMPKWSPDGKWLLFVSGAHYNCHPYVVRSDGTGLRRVASRNGYKGAVPVIDVPDFHDGSSDVPVWSADGKWIYYTAQVGQSVELMRTSLDGAVKQLTHSTTPRSLTYHPVPSPDGKWIMYGSNQSGTRQLYVMPAAGGPSRAITNVPAGYGAMFGTWNPAIVGEKVSGTI
jgi:TolB protein